MLPFYRFLLLSSFLSGSFLPGNGQPASPPAEIAGFSHPESVCQSRNTLFVSNIGAGLEPFAKDGDGFISKVDLATGRVEDLHFLPADGVLHAPKGMALYGNTLYVADIDHIVGFDIGTRKRVVDLAIAGTNSLNDLVIGDGKLYASATNPGTIFAIDLQTLAYRMLPLTDSVVGANGLCYDGAASRLYCVGVGTMKKPDGRLYAIDVHSSRVTVISNYEGVLDGLAKQGNTLYFSDWKGMDTKGVLVAVDMGTNRVREIRLSRGAIGGPADFCISEDGKYFIVPATLEGKVLIIGENAILP
ncbi:MAG TPA: hypothetical protein VNW04_07830 [Puia sp.]|nr:hypothetical protein [Puia sp.]